MKEIKELLDESRYQIDGQMDCRTAEYAALDKLHRAVELLAGLMQAAADRLAHAATSDNP